MDFLWDRVLPARPDLPFRQLQACQLQLQTLHFPALSLELNQLSRQHDHPVSDPTPNPETDHRRHFQTFSLQTNQCYNRPIINPILNLEIDRQHLFSTHSPISRLELDRLHR
jgi:hypothetical protein